MIIIKKKNIIGVRDIFDLNNYTAVDIKTHKFNTSLNHFRFSTWTEITDDNIKMFIFYEIGL